ncbi:MAG: beta-ketoacyl-[acyl-carrier-protein] synthase family protein [Solirubrobacterales bacterium]
MTRRIAITGLGAVTSLGNNSRALFDGWIAGRSGIEESDALCADFDPVDVMTRKEVRRTDRSTQLIVAAAEEAIEMAGWRDEAPYPADRIGCVIGSGVGGLDTTEAQHDVYRELGPGRVSPMTVPMMMPNAGPVAVAMREHFTGPVHGVVSACAASAQAIGVAMRLLQAGDADAFVTGGGESTTGEFAAAGFRAMGAISESGISRPFDAKRDGFVMGEGAGALVIEWEDKAIDRGAPIYGFLLGYGATTDAFHITAPDPAGTAAGRAMSIAISDASLVTEQVDYVNAHGTSTPLNDRSETTAIKLVFGESGSDVPVSSLKSSLGHLLGGAAAVEAVATISALKQRVAPPTLNYREPEPGLDLNYVPNEPQALATDQPLAYGISNSFGFGGHNAVLCLAA